MDETGFGAVASEPAEDATGGVLSAVPYDPSYGLADGASEASATVDEAALFEMTDALALDVMTNPAYSEATKLLLLEQISSDFMEYDEVGRRVATATRTSTVLRPKSRGKMEVGLASDGSLELLTPRALRLREVATQDPYSRIQESEVCGAPGTPCPLPLEWNIGGPLVYLTWTFENEAARLAYREAADGVADTGLRVLKNGVLQNRGERASSSTDVSGDYYAEYEESDCGPNVAAPCLRVVFARDAWFATAPPWSDWSIAVEMWSLEPVEQHVLGFDRFGNPIVIRESWEKQQGATATIAAPEVVKDFFTATIGLSVMSERCTTCHALDTPQKISAQHSGLVSASSVYLDDSIVSPGAQINTCDSCHVIGASAYSFSFDEERWATPTPSQDIDWGEIISAAGDDWSRAVCQRIISHLATPQARAHHFHQDARLHWAVADGVTPFGEAKTRAQPQDYFLFLKHFDAWNDAGARCPM